MQWSSYVPNSALSLSSGVSPSLFPSGTGSSLSSSLPLAAYRMCHGLRGGTEVWWSDSSSKTSSIPTEGHHGHWAGFMAAFVVVFIFAGAWVEGCFWVGAGFVLCFFASNFFLFCSTSGSPLVVSFVESLHLDMRVASGESVGIGSGCGMWFWDVVLTNVDMFLWCNCCFFLWINTTGTVQ